VADLLPQLQRRLRWSDTLAQLAWLGAGLLSVVVIGGLSQH
jgi:zinc and cadmium transporter